MRNRDSSSHWPTICGSAELVVRFGQATVAIRCRRVSVQPYTTNQILATSIQYNDYSVHQCISNCVSEKLHKTEYRDCKGTYASNRLLIAPQLAANRLYLLTQLHRLLNTTMYMFIYMSDDDYMYINIYINL